MIKTRFIFGQSYDLYQGIGEHSFGGLYDYGPVGCSIKNNMLRLWREHFILEEDMLEIATPAITPDIVFEHSGHKAKFLDFVVTDVKTSLSQRADHALESWIEKTIKETKDISAEKKHELLEISNKAGGMDQKDLQEAFTKHKVNNHENGNEFGEVRPFNLMFQSMMGPLGESPVFLRPETAQGIFMNFPRLLRFNNDKLPFAGATIGMGYRNEICPRQKLIRVREFDLAEIEYFYDPEIKTHTRVSEVHDLELPLYSAQNQIDCTQEWKKFSVKEALSGGLIGSENLAYFMARTWLFMEELGMNLEGVRFRQHFGKEMAHYAKDCWDCEILTSYGWIECVGIADRSAFDLLAHAEGTKKPMVAARIINPPRKEMQLTVDLDKGKIGKAFMKEAKNVTTHFAEMSMDVKYNFRKIIDGGESYKFIDCTGVEREVTKDFVKGFKEKEANITEEKYVPFVIEPSFGVGRIMFALLEHSYMKRDDKDILVMKANIAPVKVSLLPLFAKEEFLSYLPDIEKRVKSFGLSTKCDRSGVAIGKKYARNDEIGVPYAITIDHTTRDEAENKTVTLREILTTKQIRVPIAEVGQVLASLCNNVTPWTHYLETYPLVN